MNGDFFYDSLNSEQKEIVDENIHQTELLLADLIEATREHIQQTSNSCLRCCNGMSVGTVMLDMTKPQLVMVAALAVRVLAEQQYYGDQKVEKK